MDVTEFETASPLTGTGKDLPHLSGPGAYVRQALAAHFVRGHDHVVEIGGHIRPITPFLTHAPASVTSVDPKTEPFEAEELNGRPCRVRHVKAKFQEVRFDLAPASYALVLLGYSLKPFGHRDPLGDQLYGLIDNAAVTVIEYPLALARAADQMAHIVERPQTRIVCRLDLDIADGVIEATPFARRRMIVLEPAAPAG